MKNKIILVALVLLVMIGYGAQAQKSAPTDSRCKKCTDSSSVIIFDNNLNQFYPYPRWLKEGSSVTINVIHANSFALNSQLSATAVNSDYKEGSDVIQGIIAANNSESQKSDSAKKAVSDSSESLTSLKNNPKSSVKENTMRDEEFKRQSNMSELLNKKKEIIEKINAQIIDIDGAQNKVNGVLELDTVIVMLMNDPTISSLQQMKDRITDISRFKFSTAQEIYGNYQPNIDIIRKTLSEIRLSIGDLKMISDSLKALDPVYEFKSYIDTLQKSIEELLNLFTGTNLEKMNAEMTNIRLNYDRISSSSFIIPGDTVYVDKSDYVEIGNVLKDHKGNIYKKMEPIRINSYGGTRIDFSTGIATTFGQVNGTDFFLLRDTANNITGIDSSLTSRKYAFSPVAFVHLSFKPKSVIVPAISVGFNPDFNDFSSSKMLLGGSFGFTSTNNILRRIVFSGGVALGFADVLKPKYYDITDFSNLGSLSDSDLSEKALRLGYFFSASFNFGSVNTSSKK